jgi:hypothetical protein
MHLQQLVNQLLGRALCRSNSSGSHGSSPEGAGAPGEDESDAADGEIFSADPPKALFCYADEDKDATMQIVRALQDDGRFEPEVSNANWFHKCKHLRPQDAFVVSLSGAFVKSHACEARLMFALDMDPPIRCIGVVTDKLRFEYAISQSDAGSTLDMRSLVDQLQGCCLLVL